MPVHQHDCPHCKYLGIDSPANGEPRSVVDMYVCELNEWRLSLIRRYGSEPNNYDCVPLYIGNIELKGPNHGRYLETPRCRESKENGAD